MTSWKTYKIGDLCKISSSKRIFAKEYKDSGIPFYRGKEIIEKQKGNKISTELYISQERYDEIKAKHGVPQKDDMLLTSVGTLGIPYIVQDEVFYFKDGNLTWFYNFEGVDSRYLYYWFLSPIGKMNIDSKAIGSTQKALTIETLSKFEIFLPPLEEQRRIAGILGAIDDKIENNRRINTNLEQQAQALYKQWFVDFNFPNEEGKPYKSSGGKMINSELGLIPKEWKVGALQDVADITMGQSPNGKSFNEKGNGIVFYQGRTEFGTRYPSIRLYTTEPTRYAEPMSVLLSVRAPVGDVNIATQKCCIGRGVASIKSRTNDNAYMYCCLKELRTQLDQYNGEGTVFGSINRKELEGLTLCVPPQDIIHRFNSLIIGMDKQMFNVFQENNNLATLRDTLLPKLMNGEMKL